MQEYILMGLRYGLTAATTVTTCMVAMVVLSPILLLACRIVNGVIGLQKE